MCEHKDRDKDRPDLELERLVMGDEAREDRPAAGWVVREDVVRGAVERIKSAQDRTRQHGEDLQLAIARRNAALAEAAELREQVEALKAQLEELTAQLAEEERMIVRWRERIERAPKAKAFVRQDGGVQVFPPPWKSRSTGEHIRVAIVRLDDISLEPATTDGGKAVAPTNAERERDALRTELAATTKSTDNTEGAGA